MIISFKGDENENHKYILSLGNVMAFNNLIKSYILQYELEKDEIIYYESSKMCNYENFEIIYKIFQKSYCKENNIDKYFKIINYFCIPLQNIFIDIKINQFISNKLIEKSDKIEEFRYNGFNK